MMNAKLSAPWLAALLCFFTANLPAAAPPIISYQGVVKLAGTPFTGSGQFKFVLINQAGGATLWSNDGSSANGAQPAGSVTLGVVGGAFTALLGDAGMAALNPQIFSDAADVRLRVWFSGGGGVFTQLVPDQRIVSVPYALQAGVPVGSITAAQLQTPGGPLLGQVLSYDGTGLSWSSAGGGGGLSLPYAGSGSSTSSLFEVNNGGTGNAWAIFGRSQNSLGVFGQTLSGAAGVLGRSDGTFGQGGQGVFGYAGPTGDAAGVLGISENADGIIGVARRGYASGVVGRNDEPAPSGIQLNEDGGSGVYGYASQDATGVSGISERGHGVFGRCNGPNRHAVWGYTEHPASRAGYFAHNGGGVALRADGPAEFNGTAFFLGDGYLKDRNFYLRHDNDLNHGLGWHGAGKTWAGIEPDGPVLWGYAGGVLGTGQFGQRIAARWNTDGDLSVTRNIDCRALTIRGGADVAEPFAMSERGVEPGAVVVIDEANPGKLKRSHRAYDTRVAGIVSGAGGIRPGLSLIQEDALEPGQNVALSGRVYVLADATAGAIQPGDLLTTAETPGHAMRVAESGRAQGAILGKAMTGLREGRGLVLVLVTLQ